MPWASVATSPYLGQPVGVPAWLSVIAAVAAGVWCAQEGRAELVGTQSPSESATLRRCTTR